MKKIINAFKKHLNSTENDFNKMDEQKKINALLMESLVLIFLLLAGAGLGYTIKYFFF